MNRSIKFSIMTPVYKVEKYLDECVESVLSQSYENFELILVDDGSPDRCGEMCDAWSARDSRIRVIHKPNGGVFSARCAGLEQRSGDYCLFLDSDDYLLPGALETLYLRLSATPCDCLIFGCDKRLNGQIIERALCEEEICDRVLTDRQELMNILICTGGYNSLCRKCVKSSCFDGRDSSAFYHIRTGEDLVHSLEIFENAESYLFINEDLYVYRCNTESVMRTLNYDDAGSDYEVDGIVDAFLDKLGVFGEDDYARLRNMRLDALAVEIRRRARWCSNDEKSAASMARLREDPFVAAMVETGYRSAPSPYLPEHRSKVKTLLYKFNIALFRSRRYKLIIKLDRLMLRLAGKRAEIG